MTPAPAVTVMVFDALFGTQVNENRSPWFSLSAVMMFAAVSVALLLFAALVATRQTPPAIAAAVRTASWAIAVAV